MDSRWVLPAFMSVTVVTSMPPSSHPASVGKDGRSGMPLDRKLKGVTDVTCLLSPDPFSRCFSSSLLNETIYAKVAGMQ